jgi:hypothetical protein
MMHSNQRGGILRTAVILFLVFTLTGCEAFVRKFTRKPKQEYTEPPVLAPEEYKGPLTS